MNGWIVREIRFMPARPDLRAQGLRGWTGFEAGPFRFDSVGVRRTRSGTYRLQFPTRVDSNGVEHALFRPINSGARDEIESAVLGELRKRGYVE